MGNLNSGLSYLITTVSTWLSDDNTDAIETLNSTIYNAVADLASIDKNMEQLNESLGNTDSEVDSLWNSMDQVNLTIQDTILNVNSLNESISKKVYLGGISIVIDPKLRSLSFI